MVMPTATVMPGQRQPFQLGGGQVNTMAAGADPGVGMNYMRMSPIEPTDPNIPGGGGYDGGGINPGTPTTPPPITPPAGPMPTIPPGNVPPPTPVPPPSMGATTANPLAPLNNYQAQQGQSTYQAPGFQGSNSYQAGSYSAPQVAMPQMQGYNAQSASAP